MCKDHLTTDHNIATLELSTDTADLEDNAGGDKAQPQEATDASGENMKTIAEREELADGKVSMATQVSNGQRFKGLLSDPELFSHREG